MENRTRALCVVMAIVTAGCGDSAESGGSDCTIAVSVNGETVIQCGESLVTIPADIASCTVTESDGTVTVQCGDSSATVEDGVSCSVSEGSDGTYTITCGADVVVLEDGNDGDDCSVTDNDDGTYTVTCGTDEVTLSDGVDGTNGVSCSMVENGDGTATITCGDDEFLVSHGDDGDDGTDGVSCFMTENDDGTATITCGDDEYTIRDGVEGVDGDDGTDGVSCFMTENDDGSRTITCGDEEYTIRDGLDGVDGDDGTDGVSCVMTENDDGSRTITCGDEEVTIPADDPPLVGTLTGFAFRRGVLDHTGITVIVVGLEGGTTSTVIDGYYALSDIPIGVYEVQFQYSGYPDITLTNVPVLPGTYVIADVYLSMGTQILRGQGYEVGDISPTDDAFLFTNSTDATVLYEITDDELTSVWNEELQYSSFVSDGATIELVESVYGSDPVRFWSIADEMVKAELGLLAMEWFPVLVPVSTDGRRAVGKLSHSTLAGYDLHTSAQWLAVDSFSDFTEIDDNSFVGSGEIDGTETVFLVDTEAGATTTIWSPAASSVELVLVADDAYLLMQAPSNQSSKLWSFADETLYDLGSFETYREYPGYLLLNVDGGGVEGDCVDLLYRFDLETKALSTVTDIACPIGDAAPLDLGGDVLFWRNVDLGFEYYDLWRWDHDTELESLVTEDLRLYPGISVSPAGTHFVTEPEGDVGRDLALWSAESGYLGLIGDNVGYRPQWLADGSHVVFPTDVRNDYTLATLRAVNVSDLTVVTFGDVELEADSWVISPHGTIVAFVTYDGSDTRVLGSWQPGETPWFDMANVPVEFLCESSHEFHFDADDSTFVFHNAEFTELRAFGMTGNTSRLLGSAVGQFEDVFYDQWPVWDRLVFLDGTDLVSYDSSADSASPISANVSVVDVSPNNSYLVFEATSGKQLSVWTPEPNTVANVLTTETALLEWSLDEYTIDTTTYLEVTALVDGDTNALTFSGGEADPVVLSDLGVEPRFRRIPNTATYAILKGISGGRGELIAWDGIGGETLGLTTDVTSFNVREDLITFTVDTGSVLSDENGVYWSLVPAFAP